MAAAALSLDTGLTQVLIDFFADANYHWHRRVLVCQVDGARWIVGTPDHTVEVADLGGHRVLPVGRRAAFPPQAVGNAYVFDGFEEGRGS